MTTRRSPGARAQCPAAPGNRSRGPDPPERSRATAGRPRAETPPRGPPQARTRAPGRPHAGTWALGRPHAGTRALGRPRAFDRPRAGTKAPGQPWTGGRGRARSCGGSGRSWRRRARHRGGAGRHPRSAPGLSPGPLSPRALRLLIAHSKSLKAIGSVACPTMITYEKVPESRLHNDPGRSGHPPVHRPRARCATRRVHDHGQFVAPSRQGCPIHWSDLLTDQHHQ